MINIRPNQILQIVDKNNEACWFQIPSRGGVVGVRVNNIVGSR